MTCWASRSRRSLAGRDASVDVQDLAGYESRRRGHEETHWADNVTWLGDSPERDARLELGTEDRVVQILAVAMLINKSYQNLLRHSAEL